MAQIRNYTVRFFGGAKGFGGTQYQSGVLAEICLFGFDNHLLGRIQFKPQNECLKDENGATITLQMGMEMLQPVMNMLHQEAPVYLYWQNKLETAYFGTGQEPVGEGEGK